MKTLIISLFILTLFFAGCAEQSSNNSSTSLSSATMPVSLGAGTVIAVNPRVEIVSNLTVGSTASASYSNTTTVSSYPSSVSGNVSVTLTTVGSNLKLSFIADGKMIDWVMSDFIDRGGDGHTDEFTISATIDGAPLSSSVGQFVGAIKPPNLNVASPVITNKTPTRDEFYNHLVGFAIRVENPSDQNDVNFLQFVDKVNFNYLDGDTVLSGTYIYEEAPVGGIIEYKINSNNEGKIGVAYDNSFYSGTWSDIEYTDNGVPATQSELGTGTFKVYSGTDDLINFLF